MTAERPRLSACIITCNEADRIEDCIASVAFCNDIVVVDSGSTDETQALAASAGARVLERPFDGFRSQKNFAVAQAEHDWVLCLDADERVTPTLRDAIDAARNTGFAGASGYEFARLSMYFGCYLRHGNAYPDRVLRLFDRRHGGYRGTREVHEKVSVNGKVAILAGDIEHHPYRSFSAQMAKQEKYASMMAEHDYARGKRSSLAKILFHPIGRFMRGYLFRAGFLDGWRGLVYALTRLEYVRSKYVKLWLLQHGQKP